MEDLIIVEFNIVKRKESYDLEIPIDITTRDLLIGLNEAFALGADLNNMDCCYLKCEYPIALMRGNKKIKEYGLRNGSIINFTE